MSKQYFADQTYQSATEIPPGEYEGCTFKKGKLANADLSGRLFLDCTFVDCDLTNVKLEDTGLQTVAFKGCKLLGTQFNGCRDFLLRVSFKACNMELVSFAEMKLKGTTFKDCQLRETDFVGADLREASFNGCDLMRALIERTDLRKADFRKARNYHFSPEENRLRGAKFSVDGLPGLLSEYGIEVS